jgi:DNA-binding beta-propeller fold protein YncE
MSMPFGLWRLGSIAIAIVAVSAIGLAVNVAPDSAATALPTAYVTNSQLTSVSMFVGSRFAGVIPDAGSGPTGIAVDSNGSTAYVADYGFLAQPAHTVTPINLATDTADTPITVGLGPLAIAVTPGDRFALVTLQGTAAHPGHWVREINLATRALSPPVNVGLNPESLAITPDGTTAYVAAFSSAQITPVDLTAWPPHARAPIRLPNSSPRAIAIAPDGHMAYVLDAAKATVTPISIPGGTVGTPVDLVCRMQGDPGCTPSAIAISRDGRTAFVSAAGSADMIMLDLPSLTVAGVIATGGYPDALGLSGRWVFVANGASNTMSVFSGLHSARTAGGVTYPFGVAVVPAAGAGIQRIPRIDLPSASSRAMGVGSPAVLARPAPFYGVSPG